MSGVGWVTWGRSPPFSEWVGYSWGDSVATAIPFNLPPTQSAQSAFSGKLIASNGGS